MPKEPNWWPGIQRQAPFKIGVEPDNPRHMTRAQKKAAKAKPPEQDALPMDVSYIKPSICPDCLGLGRLKKGRICNECGGRGVVPAKTDSQGEIRPKGDEGEEVQDGDT